MAGRRGTKFDDTLVGTDRNDAMWGFGGDDYLSGMDGNDRMYGGSGKDTMHGGAGSDTMLGETGNDRINGGLGFDTLEGGEGNDILSGGIGYYTDVLRGERGNDVLFGENGNDRLFGGVGNDSLVGGEGSDILDGGRGADFLIGGGSVDFFRFKNGDGKFDNVRQGDFDDFVTDYQDGVDKFDFSGSTVVNSLADIEVVNFTSNMAGAGAYIKYGDESYVFVVGYSTAQFSASDFIF